MKYLLALMIAILLLMPYAEASAMRRGKAVTPYGGSCAECGHYGTCKSDISTEDAEKAITDYYSRQGLDIEMLDVEDRFIRANVKDKDKVIDSIIFDRRTGRIRSTF